MRLCFDWICSLFSPRFEHGDMTSPRVCIAKIRGSDDGDVNPGTSVSLVREKPEVTTRLPSFNRQQRPQSTSIETSRTKLGNFLPLQRGTNTFRITQYLDVTMNLMFSGFLTEQSPQIYDSHNRTSSTSVPFGEVTPGKMGLAQPQVG